MINKLARKINNTIRTAIISYVYADDSNIQKAQITQHDITKDVQILTPHGYYSIAPIGSQVHILQVNGSEENLVGLADDVNNRPKNLLTNEVCLMNTLTGDKVYLTNAGINIVSKTAINITAPLITNNGNTIINGTILAGGFISADSSTGITEDIEYKKGNGTTGVLSFKNGLLIDEII